MRVGVTRCYNNIKEELLKRMPEAEVKFRLSGITSLSSMLQTAFSSRSHCPDSMH